MKKYSIWQDGIQKIEEPILKEDISCDVLIIGAGMTGLSTAYHLRNKNLKIVVVEKNEVGGGISARTTGKITYLQETIYQDLEKKKGIETSKKYFFSQKEAIQLIRNIIKKHHIDCDFEQVTSYVFTKQKNAKILEEKKILEQFGVSVEEVKKKKIQAIGVEDTYVFHPLKYIQSLEKILKRVSVE